MKNIIFLLIIFPFTLTAQKHDNIWITGYNGQNPHPLLSGTFYDFSSQPPEIYRQEIDLNFWKTNASISNSQGNLLFYTNGGYIFNASHELMENGDSLSAGEYADIFADGGFPVTQGALILPKPNHDSIYLLFHNKIYQNGPDPSTYDLLMTEININLDNGKGAVINKNQTLIPTVLTRGKITATKHANGRDWWIVVFEKYNDTFYQLLLTPNGIEQINEQDMEVDYPDDAVGMSCFTPDGSKYIKYDLRLLPIGNVLDIYDFDRCTGELSNPLKISVGDTTGLTGGIAISPNSQYLYASSRYRVFQFDLLVEDIASSKKLIAEYDGFSGDYTNTHFNQPQLAPDGKIYMTTDATERYFHRINLPNLAGEASDVEQHAFQTPTYMERSFPNFPNYRLGPLDGSPCDTLGLDNHPLAGFTWETDSLTAIFSDNTSYEPTTWLWDFDGLGTDTVPNPMFTFPTEGNYNVCQIVSNQYDADTTCHEITVSFLAAAFSHEAEELSVDFLDESISEPFDWFWEFGDGETSNLQNPNHEYATVGQYEVCLTVMDEWAEARVCDSVAVDILDGVEDLGEEAIFKISPNPAKEEAMITLNGVALQGNFKLIIQNLMGKVVENIIVKNQQLTYSINLGNYESGIYYVSQLENGKVVNTKKLVVIK